MAKWLYTLKHEIHLNNLKKYSSCLKKIHRISITTINWLILFRILIAIHTETL
jgi:hypothetical protein